MTTGRKPRMLRAMLMAAMLAGFAPVGVLAQAAPAPGAATPAPERLPRGLAGAYLAGRSAAGAADFAAAATYFARAAQLRPTDPMLTDSALIALVSAGRMDEARALAGRAARGGEGRELARLVRRADLAREGDWDGLLALLDAAPAPPADGPQGGRLLDGLLRGWALMGAGRASDATAALGGLADLRSAAPVVQYHLGLMRATAGDHEGAAPLLAGQAEMGNLLGVIAQAQSMALAGQRAEALALLDALPALPTEPALQALRAQLAADLPIAFDVVARAEDGIAQVFLTFAGVLASGPDPDPLALVHARLAGWVAPTLAEARLMAAQLLQEQDQFDLAGAEYDAVRGLGPLRPVAALTRIDALARAGRDAEALEAARALTADQPDLAGGWVALGDALRRTEAFADAVPAYDRALEMTADAPPDSRWFALYARGIALERSGQFDRAEADLKAAIAIRPDSASLLNYLGYSWIDRNENLDEGLALIERAVALAPDDGYILDSLAWAFYRLGRYDEAVAPMERAAMSMSTDPVINDHLGDIYWKVGRTREAEVQWRRTLSLPAGDSGEVDLDRVRAKLDRGLDAVLADETAGRPTTAPAPEARPADG